MKVATSIVVAIDVTYTSVHENTDTCTLIYINFIAAIAQFCDTKIYTYQSSFSNEMNY